MGVLYFVWKRKDSSVYNQSNPKAQKGSDGFLQKFERFFAKREAESISDFKIQPLRWAIIKTIVVPVVALGVRVGGGSQEMATYATGIVFVVIMKYVHITLKNQQLDERRKKIVGFILLGSAVFAILIIALF